MRIVQYLHFQFLSLITLLILHCLSGNADAAIACYQCHGTTSPADYRPLDAAYRDPSTGGFQGNHRPHMGSAATASSCAPCHPGSGDYTPSHRDGKIKLASNINNSPLNARYNNSTSAFSQTPSPSLSTCSNVNCHFEATTPTWGGAVFNSTDSCSQCHGSTTPLSASHTTHSRYSSVTMGKFSNHAACATCHVNYTSSLNFAHATSVSRRPINVTVGTYNSGSTTYLPSQTHGAYGTCTNLYCHSPGNKSTTPFTSPNQTATWGGTLGCAGCHAATPSTGSHAGHVETTYGVPVACYKCHAATVSAGMTVDATSNHVNNKVDIAFSSTTTAVQGKYSGHLTPMQKNPGSGYENCENVYCHSNGQGAGGSWPPTYKTPKWGSGNPGECGLACHDNGLHGGADITSGSHEKHISYGFVTAGFFVGCTICHYGAGYAEPLCTQCHYGAPTLTTLHVNHKVEVSFVTMYGGAYNGTPEPGDGYSSCSTVYCHSNGTSVATGTVPANTSPAWGSGAMACDGCHGNPPNYASASPKANSHSIHAVHSVSDCSICHYGTTTTGTTITDNTKHVNKAYELQAKPGYTFIYTYAANGGSCTTVSCHGNAQWGTGSAGGSACITCHGHSAGYEYEAGKFSQGKGSWRSHATHTQNDGDNAKGPNIACNGCHDTNNFPYFITGTDGNADGKYNLSETDVCNTCHSPGGTYDGVGNATYGAKANWDFGIYSSGLIRSGKEKWCASCHDDSASVISGVTAPNVVGNESETYNYGTGWGYYKTGHGLMSTSTIPSSGGASNGPGKSCTDCHNAASGHVDGNQRSFECASGTGGACTTQYKSGYRLMDVGGNAPMEMPPTGTNAASFRLCFSCHTNTDAWLTNNRAGTNFYQEGTSRNDHYYHLTAAGKTAENDWDGSFEGWLSCINCHNVHGSKNPAMVRSEELTGFTSMSVRYGNAGSTHTPGHVEPVPNNITLVESSKLTMLGTLANQYCDHCHGTGTAIMTVARAPAGIPATPPVLSWVDIPGYEADGVNPNSGKSGDTFTFRVTYSDINQDAPTKVQLWVDLDNNNDYDGVGEKVDMQQAFAELDPYTPYSRGVDFVATSTFSKSSSGGNNIKYKFHAESGADVATGAPTNESTLNILNDAPTLGWTGEAGYTDDGVNPDYGPKDGSYAFRVKYTDNDGDACPTSGSDNIQVWIDLNGDLFYDAGEKFNLTAVDPGDNDCTEAGGGKLYYLDKNLPNTSGSNKEYRYRFYASDGTSLAIGSPVEGGTVTVAGTPNNPPYLAWNSGVCRPQGAMPPKSTTSSSINFSVKYFDEDNQYPASGSSAIQVWVDLDKSGTYSADEKFNLVEDSPADTDCTTTGGGKTYSVNVTPTTVANGITYEFHATDGTDSATGTPVSGGTVDIIAANAVVKKDGTEDYTTISAAISGTGSGETILVYDGTYTEYVTYSSRTLLSACGPEDTIISNTNNPTVRFYQCGDVTLDGFTVTGSTGNGIYAENTNYSTPNCRPVFNDLIIRNNAGRGINGVAAPITLSDSEIYSNTGGGVKDVPTITDTVIRDNSVTGDGGGIYGSSDLTNVIIKDNTATGNGGGIYCSLTGNQEFTYDEVVLSRNTATAGSGGGGYFHLCNPTFTNGLVSDNTATNGGGIAVDNSGIWFLNSTIVNNTATGDGGGYYGTYGWVSLANSIAWGNRADGLGHIGRFTATSGTARTADLYDSIIENNGDDNITDDNYFIETVIINVVDKGSNHDADPNFVDATNTVKAMRNYHVQDPSIAIDNAADTSTKGIPADDLDGNNRTSGEEDIGAYEAPDPNLTTVGAALAVAPDSTETSINFSMSYSGDVNSNNTYQTRYCLSSNCSATWSAPQSHAHSASPYTSTISGLTPGETYNVEMTYIDADGIVGTNPVVQTGIKLKKFATVAGTATATMSSLSSIGVTMPYTGDDDGDNSYSVEYKLTSSGTWTPHVTGVSHVASPYSTTISGLTPGESYDVRVTYGDPDGVSGSNPQNLGPVAIVNNAPVGGYSADNVIPTAQIAQSTSGDGKITITWKGTDAESNNVTLKTFQYSVDGGATWNAPANDDASASLSANWANNGGSGYTTATTFAAAAEHNLTFDTKHADVTGMAGVDQSDVQVRFTLNDGIADSALPATSDNVRVDNLAPTALFCAVIYNEATNTMTLSGTNFTTIAATGTDIKSYVDWSKLVWDINGDGSTTANITFADGDISSLTVTDDSTLTLVFTTSKGTAIEATSDYGATGDLDTYDISAGFIMDAKGNAAVTDALTHGSLSVLASGKNIYVVTKTADTRDGTCDGDCSLREAIDATNARTGGDIITIPAGTYTITLSGAEDLNATGDFDITKSVVIQGNCNAPIIDANSVDRVFDAKVGAALTLASLELKRGSVSSGKGGCVQMNDQIFTATDVSFDTCTVTTSGGSGGGVYASTGFNITRGSFLSNSAPNGGAVSNAGADGNFYGANTFTGNIATGYSTNAGGAIYSTAKVNINDAGSLFSQNTGNGSGGAVWVSSGSGSGYFNIYGATTFDNNGTTTIGGTTYTTASGGAIIARGGTINDTTFTNNKATGFGGALYFVNAAGTVNRSTFSGNYLTGTSNGGAFYSNVTGNNINNCTFYNNSAGPGVAGTSGNGGAIYQNAGIANINYTTFYDNLGVSTSTAIKGGAIKNSIVANSSGSLTLCSSSTDGGTNLQFNGTCVATFTTGDPNLSALANNGGPTQTMALQSGSPAINAGTTGTCLGTDQRGATRPVNGACDIGAFEYGGTVP